MAFIKSGKYLIGCEGSMSVTLDLTTVSITELRARRYAQTHTFC